MGSKTCKPVLEYELVADLLKPHDALIFDMQFQRLSKASDVSRGRIDKDTFIDEILKPRMPESSRLVLERTFTVLDTDASGFIEYREFVVAMYLFMFASREEKLQLLFNLYDLDGNGQINKKEFKKMAVTLMQSKEAKEDEKIKPFASLIDLYVLSTFDVLDRTNDAFLNISKFHRFAEEDDILLSVLEFMAAVDHQPEDIAAAVRQREVNKVSGALNALKKKKKDRKTPSARPSTEQMAGAASIPLPPMPDVAPYMIYK
jgi:Ca2+-binding EF-hand superfamily protein